MVQWFNGSMVQWFNGSMVQWFNGSMVQWFNKSPKIVLGYPIHLKSTFFHPKTRIF
jgi:hypothetical protein